MLWNCVTLVIRPFKVIFLKETARYVVQSNNYCIVGEWTDVDGMTSSVIVSPLAHSAHPRRQQGIIHQTFRSVTIPARTVVFADVLYCVLLRYFGISW